MKLGVVFNIDQSCEDNLYKIMMLIQNNNFYWHVVRNQSEIWREEYLDDFFEKEVYHGEEMEEKTKEKHHVIFAKLQGYLQIDAYQNICSFKDYIDSKCQIVILIYDCENVEIFIKDEEMVTELHTRAQKENFDNLHYITNEMNQRISFEIV